MVDYDWSLDEHNDMELEGDRTRKLKGESNTTTNAGCGNNLVMSKEV